MTTIKPIDSTALVHALSVFLEQVASTAAASSATKGVTGSVLAAQLPAGQSATSSQQSAAPSGRSMLTTPQTEALNQALTASINQLAQSGALSTSSAATASSAVADPSINAVTVPTAATNQVGTGSPLLASAGQTVQAGLRYADTSTKAVPGAGAAVVAKPTQATYLGWQDLATKQTRSSYQTNTYAGLQQNKAAVNSALKASGASPQESALVMASGMMETANMSAASADQLGQNGDKGPNLFNMNIGMLHDLGYKGDGSDLADPSKAVPWMVKAIRTFGPEGFLAYHRGGASGYIDGNSHDVASYVQNASRISNILMANPAMMTNNLRIE